MRHDARGRGAVIGKIALLQRADRSAHDKTRDPGAIGGAALGAAAIGQRTARKYHTTQLDMAQVRCAFKDVEHGSARGELDLRCHGLDLLGR